MVTICVSSGHGKHVRGASGIIDEVDEARKVVDRLEKELVSRGATVHKFHDDKSKNQNDNLNAIVNWHNSKKRDVDISVHFNAYEQVEKAMGTEVLFYSQQSLATEISAAIASCGFINRGAKKRTDLKFLNSTSEPAVLLEICFVDSAADCDVYGSQFGEICEAIADELAGSEDVTDPIAPVDASFHAIGKCSKFGGPNDTGVSDDEGLAFIQSKDDAPHLFLPEHPDWNKFGLARQLNPFVHFVACRWDYERTPKPTLLENVALVKSLKNGTFMTAFPADWGPHESTGRIADLSPGLMADLGIDTDDEVEVIYPWTGE